MAKVTIGGKEYEVPPLNFKGIKKVWPHVAKLLKNGDDLPIEDALVGVDVAIIALSSAFERTAPEMTVDWIEENLLPEEITGLQFVLKSIMSDSGLIKTGELETGEAEAVQGAANLTETSTL